MIKFACSYINDIVLNRKKKKLGAYPFVSVIFSITLAVLVVGIFATLLLYSTHLKKSLQENITMQVYMHRDLDDSTLTSFKEYLNTSPFVLHENGKARIEYISREQAAKDFIKQTGEDFISFIGENPLRDTYVIHINADYADDAKLKLVKTKIEEKAGVFEVNYIANLVSQINENMRRVGSVLGALALILLAVSIILIHNTIKLSLYSQRFLIRSMQLVGATSGFIRWPFLGRALLHGLIAGFLSVAILFGIIEYVNAYLIGMKIQSNLVQTDGDIYTLFGSMLVLGSAIGFFSTFSAVSKYLRMSLDELY